MNLFMYTFAAILGFSSLVMGHMSLQYPLQFKTPWNPQRDAIDPDHRDPIIRNSLPCKSTHEGMTSESSVVTWAAGSTQRVVVTGSAVHDGGSCQLSLNYDQGKTFRVIHSMVRGCPHNDAFGYDFQLPGDTAPDLAIFSWSWLNKTGNRESYQKCAAVTMTRRSGSPKIRFCQRPLMFEANLGGPNSVCKSMEGVDVVFPDPGPDVIGSLNGPTGLSGSCGTKGKVYNSEGNGGGVSGAAPVTSGAFSKSVFSGLLWASKHQQNTRIPNTSHP